MSEAKAHSSGPSNEPVTTPINAIYTPATLRCVTRPVGNEMGIAFNRDDGLIVRLRVSMEDAIVLARTILDVPDPFSATDHVYDHGTMDIIDSTSIGITDAQSIIEAVQKQNEMILKGLLHVYSHIEHVETRPKQEADSPESDTRPPHSADQEKAPFHPTVSKDAFQDVVHQPQVEFVRNGDLMHLSGPGRPLTESELDSLRPREPNSASDRDRQDPPPEPNIRAKPESESPPEA